MKTQRKISTILLMSILTVTLVPTAALAASSTSSTPSYIQNIRDQMKNPAPFQNVLAPLSESAYRYLSDPSIGTASSSSAGVQYPKQTAYSSSALSASSPASNDPLTRWNLENGNIPQDEESLAAYHLAGTNFTQVVEGANDYRGLFGSYGSCGLGLSLWATGYYFNTPATPSLFVTREGCLSPLTGISSNGAVYAAQSFGDPMLSVFPNGTFVYGSLFEDFATGTSAIGVAKGTFNNIANGGVLDPWDSCCGGYSAKAQVAADNVFTTAFNDKPSQAVGNNVIYEAWTQFTFTTSKIMIARCITDFTGFHCIQSPLGPISPMPFSQGSWVSVEPNGNVALTWVSYDFSPYATAPFYKEQIWYAVLNPDLTAFVKAPTFVLNLAKPISFSGIQGEFFRTPNLPQNAAGSTAAGTPQLLIMYQDCFFGTYLIVIPSFREAVFCSASDVWTIQLNNPDAPGLSGSFGPLFAFSGNGPSAFFPSITIDALNHETNIEYYTLWFTNAKYAVFNTYQRCAVPFNSCTGQSYQFISDPSQQSFFFFGNFIGDYQQIVVLPGIVRGSVTENQVYVGSNGNLRYSSPIWYTISGLSVQIGGNNDDNYVQAFVY
jgi:hypothetical protein